MAEYQVAPIGRVESPRSDPVDDDWGSVTASIVLDERRFGPDALAEIDGFSHLEIVFLFHRVDESSINVGSRRPRGNPDWPPVGIFAQRGKARPNRIGVSICELRDVDGIVLRVGGLDAIDGTPVLDIKPVMIEFAPRTAVRQPDWAHELMRSYW